MRKEWDKQDIEWLKENSYRYSTKEMGCILNRNYCSINHKLHRLHIHSKNHHEKRYVNEDFFKIWSEEMAYTLGFWFADGCIGRWGGGYRFSLSSKDFEHLEKIKCLMKSTHSIKTRKHRKSEYSLTISNKRIYNDIIALGGSERKSLTATFPYIPHDNIRHFIRGYFDGDGSVTLRGGKEPRISFIGSRQFIYMLNCNLPYQTIPYDIGDSMCNISHISEYAQEILYYMYSNAHVYLNRKFELYKKAMNWKRQRNVRSDSVSFKLNGLPKMVKYESCNSM